MIDVSEEWTLQQQIRFALNDLGARDGTIDFQRLCFELACVTIASNFTYPAGPVGAGGDQGRDFETYWPAKCEIFPEGTKLGVERGQQVVGRQLGANTRSQLLAACAVSIRQSPQRARPARLRT